MGTRNPLQDRDVPRRASDKDKAQADVAEPQETTPVAGKQKKKWGLIRAGEVLDRPLIAICTECEAELTFEPGCAVRPCGKCGNDVFRVVS